MADLALRTANKVEIVGMTVEQYTGVAAEAIAAGSPVRFDTSTGLLTPANGTSAGEARVVGLATRLAAAGEAVTFVKRGILDGIAIDALAYDAAVYLSDTDGTLASTAGTVSTIVGRVFPAHAQTLGTAPDKVLYVML